MLQKPCLNALSAKKLTRLLITLTYWHNCKQAITVQDRPVNVYAFAFLSCLFMSIMHQAQTQTFRSQEFGFGESLLAICHQPRPVCPFDSPELPAECSPLTFEVSKLARSKLPVSPNQLNFVSLYPE